MARAPRVFTWSDGLHVYTVATSSKIKALAAWGVTRDLFKDGEARELLTGDDVEAALSKPGEVVRRALAVATPAPPGRTEAGRAFSPGRPRGPTEAERTKLRELEGKVAELERESGALDAEIAARRARLEREAEMRKSDLQERELHAARELKEFRSTIVKE